MPTFQIHANDIVFGLYEGDTLQEALDKCAVDAGYKSEADLIAQLGRVSQLIAVDVSIFSEAVNCASLFESGMKSQATLRAENQSIRVEQDWENESTIYIFSDRSGIYSRGSVFRVATANEIALENY